MSSTFAELGLPDPILEVLETSGIATPFPIQVSAIPEVMAGTDVAACAPTGSGKTLAFGLPMLATTQVAVPRRPTSLVLTPTRELAAQIRRDLAPFAKSVNRQAFAVYGGVRYGAQIDWLERGVDLLVATPGRLEDLIEQEAVDLGDVGIVTVDEADRMADMGFLPAVRRILDRTRDGRQTLLFSATLDGDVAVLMEAYQSDPVRLEAGAIVPRVTEATHLFWDVERTDKVGHTAAAIRASGSTIVFARTRHGVDRLARQLQQEGVAAVAMHGGRSQAQRNRALADFRDGAVRALVATDVAARGIHVDDVATVVHYDPPHGHKDYLHRSGRTARAGASGTVVSLVLRPERRAVNRIKRHLDLDTPTVPPNHAPIGAPTRTSLDSAPVAPDTPSEPVDRGTPKRSATPSTRRPTGHVGIFVSNLPWSTTDRDLAELFRRHGKVSSAVVQMDRRGRSKGIGIVAMPEPAAAKAIAALDGRKIKGRVIEVRREREV